MLFARIIFKFFYDHESLRNNNLKVFNYNQKERTKITKTKKNTINSRVKLNTENLNNRNRIRLFHTQENKS